jgi:nicotinate-nucleotide adenylyltransferase
MRPDGAAGRGLQAALGGTFNPIHFGHLRTAQELVQRLPIDCLRLVPARVPPHRAAPRVTAEHRAAMVELALAGEERIVCDRRELRRDGPSYTVDTLASLRDELGPTQSLAWIVGVDAAAGLADWYRWRDLFALAHLIVVARPGATLPASGAAARELQSRACSEAELTRGPAGGVWCCELTPQPVSSTQIRALLQSSGDVSKLVPEPVRAYIARHGLYRDATQAAAQQQQ